jgi:membrane-associated HD superfamily phosphohydrolase
MTDITPLIFEALDEMDWFTLIITVTTDYCSRLPGFRISIICSGLLSHDSSKVLRYERHYSGIVVFAFLFSARLIIPNRVILPYIFPIQALGLTIACLSGNRLGIIFSIIISILAPYDFTDAICYTTFYIVSSITGILVLRKGRQISSFFLAGLSSGFIGIPIILAYQFTNKATDASDY